MNRLVPKAALWWRGGSMRWAGLSSGIAFRYLAVISLSERVAGPGGDTLELSYCIRRTRLARPRVAGVV